MYKIIFYKDVNGQNLIKEYIKSLKQNDSKDNNIKFKKIISYIRILQQEGISIGKPYVKHIEGKIWELRPLRDRILFAYCDNNEIVLLTIFMKQTQKTPRREIKKAKKLLEDYLKRSDWKWVKNFKPGMNLKRS